MKNDGHFNQGHVNFIRTRLTTTSLRFLQGILPNFVKIITKSVQLYKASHPNNAVESFPSVKFHRYGTTSNMSEDNSRKQDTTPFSLKALVLETVCLENRQIIFVRFETNKCRKLVKLIDIN